MPIHDHTIGSTFSRQVPKPAPDIDEIHIDPMIDDGGFAVCGEHLRVDVFPPNTDPDLPGAFISICESNLGAEHARRVAVLVLVAAEYVNNYALCVMNMVNCCTISMQRLRNIADQCAGQAHIVAGQATEACHPGKTALNDPGVGQQNMAALGRA